MAELTFLHCTNTKRQLTTMNLEDIFPTFTVENLTLGIKEMLAELLCRSVDLLLSNLNSGEVSLEEILQAEEQSLRIASPKARFQIRTNVLGSFRVLQPVAHLIRIGGSDDVEIKECREVVSFCGLLCHIIVYGLLVLVVVIFVGSVVSSSETGCIVFVIYPVLHLVPKCAKFVVLALLASATSCIIFNVSCGFAL